MKVAIKMKRFVVILLMFMPFFGIAHAQERNWAGVDRIGTYNSVDEGQFSDKGLWDGYSQKQAQETLYRLPDHLASPVYRSLVKRILLSSSPASAQEVESPALLSQRLQLLIHYGLIDEARSLFNAIPENYDPDDDMGLALVKLQLSLLDGDIAPTCLDIQATSAQFRDNTEWKELTDYCRLRFGSAGKNNLNEAQFISYPSLSPLLTDANISYSRLKDMEILLANADNRLFHDNYYNTAAKNISSLSDLLIYMGSDTRYVSQKTYQCFVVEAAKRGVRDSAYIESAYLKAPINRDDLERDVDQVEMNDCDIPAFFYQKVILNTDQNDRNIILDNLFRKADSISARALLPFAPFLAKARIDSANQWKAAVILAMNGDSIPDSYLPTALPIERIESQQTMNEKDYIEWLNISQHEKILERNKIDIAAPLYLLQINSGEFNKLLNNKAQNKYENIFSLTYEKNSLNLGLGYSGFMAGVLKRDDIVDLLTRSLGLMADNSIHNYSTEDAAVILSALKAVKLEKESVMLTLEYLQ